jgi:hypothetical protein
LVDFNAPATPQARVRPLTAVAFILLQHRIGCCFIDEKALVARCLPEYQAGARPKLIAEDLTPGILAIGTFARVNNCWTRPRSGSNAQGQKC